MPINTKPIGNEKNYSNNIKTKDVENKFLFEIISPKISFENMILKEETYDTLQDIISALEYKELIYSKWGLAKVMPEYKGICANFYGEPGTGKSMAANAIANKLGKKILKVNYSDIESKYVGETSKNIVKLFNEAEKLDVVLLFDEADALLSKRVTDMSSSTDVSVNQTRSVLLTTLESYRGIVIFTTNFISNFDTAFMRRIPYHVKFDLPNSELRERLWRYYLVEDIPTKVNFKVMANKYSNINCCDISNAVFTTVLKAARNKLNFIPQSYFEESIEKIIEAKKANKKLDRNIKVETREVSEEFAISQINKGGN